MSQLRLLVVEDDLDGQEAIATMLEHMNFEVHTADTGEQAVAALFESGNRYDAALIDLALPGMDGWDVLRTVMESPDTENMPCIAVTGYHTSKLREQALMEGFTAYFSKPIDSTMLGRELEQILR